tara:strand:- start:263 stop:529 length:267 start_codon:yes stop_codon:yes gene_type:complete
MRVRKYANKFLNKSRGVATPLFLWYDDCTYHKYMDREKLKLVVKNLKSLVNVLESEVYSDTSAYKIPDDEDKSFGFNYDDGDDDGYPD